MAIRGPGRSGPTPKTLPTMASPSATPPTSMAGERLTPRTPAEFWAQRMADVAEPAQGAIGDKRYQLPRLGRRAARRDDRERQDGFEGRERAIPANPAMPSTGTVATPAVSAAPTAASGPLLRPPEVAQVRPSARRPTLAFPTGMT
jgi:hypothetical protein